MSFLNRLKLGVVALTLLMGASAPLMLPTTASAAPVLSPAATTRGSSALTSFVGPYITARQAVTAALYLEGEGFYTDVLFVNGYWYVYYW